MAEHYEELPVGMSFPTADDMRQWQLLFEKAVPGGNSAELIGFKFADGHLFGICRNKDGSDAGPMTKGYWVAFVDVTDPEGYKAYIAENAKAFGKFGARFLTRGGQGENPEGQPRSRVVVIEFPSYDAAVECYRSPEYAKAMALRAGKAIMDLAIVPGAGGPKSGKTPSHAAET